MEKSTVKVGVGLATFLAGYLIVSVFATGEGAAWVWDHLGASPSPTAEEKSEIYSEIINRLFGEEKGKFFVISESTWPTNVADPAGDFEMESLGKGKISKDMALPVRYVLLGDRDLENEAGGGGWPAISKNYPGACAYLAFSEIGLNKSRDKAFVTVEVTSETPEGRYEFFLVKNENKWTIEKKVTTLAPCAGGLRRCGSGRIQE
jgi:hypothetical protein